jgi:hypothetical protein
MSDDICECPKCGRLHRNLGFGSPPGSRAEVIEVRTLDEMDAAINKPGPNVEVLPDGSCLPLSSG